MTTTDLHLMTGAYALHALSDEERVAVERHLAGCGPCAREVAELSATAARLGLAATVTPPAPMRDQVLRRVTAVRQEPPGPARASHHGRARLRTRLLSRWTLAACLAGAAVLGGAAVQQHQEARDAAREARRAQATADGIAAVLASPDATTRAASLGDGATGTVVVSRTRDRAVFVVSGMARPARGRVYQLWFDDAGTMRPAGLMDPGRSDQAVLLKGRVDGASGMGVTVEPAGGSAHPTSAPVALMPFPA
ncbi:anti-sigma factor domain-containing protein [Streptomyces sp. VRA16 Mangrove soil]|uniref:anti-sigma factor n=1 Tax=Streptomyces sp. VRA16 Mangrove soil TaxID=2817434 RepID=UPI001A9E80A6|nr:anti-sigma factor [Streptomyces sp. VRA16 Mangrove soil]MBO1332281.1 anti-sigma factor [Streptomyces sp. VRA16 Mangrove soil]